MTPPPTHWLQTTAQCSAAQWARTRTLRQHIVTPSQCRMSDTWPIVSTISTLYLQYLHCNYTATVSTHSMTDPAARLPFLIFSSVPVSVGQVLRWWGGPGGRRCHHWLSPGALWGEVTLRRPGRVTGQWGGPWWHRVSLCPHLAEGWH